MRTYRDEFGGEVANDVGRGGLDFSWIARVVALGGFPGFEDEWLACSADGHGLHGIPAVGVDGVGVDSLVNGMASDGEDTGPEEGSLEKECGDFLNRVLMGQLAAAVPERVACGRGKKRDKDGA